MRSIYNCGDNFFCDGFVFLVVRHLAALKNEYQRVAVLVQMPIVSALCCEQCIEHYVRWP